MYHPKLRHAVLLGLPAAWLFAGCVYAAQRTPPAALWAGVFGLTALVVGGSALAAGFNWLVFQATRRIEERRQAEAITPRLEELRAAARLTPEQARLVAGASGGAEVGVAAGEDGPRYYLITRSGSVPMDFVEDYFRDCGMWKLRPVRTYPEGTPARAYAQAVTDWCVQLGLAAPAVGSNPAQWISEHSRARAARLIGLEWDRDGS